MNRLYKKEKMCHFIEENGYSASLPDKGMMSGFKYLGILFLMTFFFHFQAQASYEGTIINNDNSNIGNTTFTNSDGTINSEGAVSFQIQERDDYGDRLNEYLLNADIYVGEKKIGDTHLSPYQRNGDGGDAAINYLPTDNYSYIYCYDKTISDGPHDKSGGLKWVQPSGGATYFWVAEGGQYRWLVLRYYPLIEFDATATKYDDLTVALKNLKAQEQNSNDVHTTPDKTKTFKVTAPPFQLSDVAVSIDTQGRFAFSAKTSATVADPTLYYNGTSIQTLSPGSSFSTTIDNFNKDYYLSGKKFKFEARQNADHSRLYVYKEIDVPQIAVFNGGLTVEPQTTGEIKLSWKTTNPDGVGTLTRGFKIFKRIAGGEWTECATQAWTSGITAYSYTYPIPEEERQKGQLNYEFKVVRDGIEDASNALFCITYSKDINTDYAKVSEMTFDASTRRIYFKEESGIKPTGFSWVITSQEHGSSTQTTLSGLTNIEAGDPYFEKYSYYVASGIKECVPTTYTVQGKVDTKVVSKNSIECMYKPDTKSEVSSFTASKGYYNNHIDLKWAIPANANGFSSFIVGRSALNDTAGIAEFEAYNKPYDPETKTINFTNGAGGDGTIAAGTFYRYNLYGVTKCDTNTVKTLMKTDVGYAQAYGQANGKVIFTGTSTGVPGVDIAFENISATDNSGVNRALDMGSVGYFSAPAPYGDHPEQLAFQLWVKLNNAKPAGQVHTLLEATDKTKTPETSVLSSWIDSDMKLNVKLFGQTVTYDTILPVNEYFHLTQAIVHSDNAYQFTAYLNGKSIGTKTLTYNPDALPMFNQIYVSNAQPAKHLDGVIDELRIWNRILTSTEIAVDYNRYILASSNGLVAYYRFDEPDGVRDNAYDLSENADIDYFNENHAILVNSSRTTLNAPSAENLAIKASTDIYGNYSTGLILPYKSGGSSYMVTPMLGVHQFAPQNTILTVSDDKNTMNDVNFTDNSKFTYNGRVIYQGGNFPVEGCSFLIDGAQQSNTNNEPVLSDADGKFSLSIPVGTHTIKIQKMGHTFVNDTIRRNFQDEELAYNVRFEDVTRIRIVGRVVGGTVEGTKPLGFGMAKNNVGPATIVLQADKDNYTFITGGKDTAVTHFDSKRNNTVNYNGAQISIQTNDETGEFYADVYPENFRLMHIYTDTLTNRTDYLDNISQQWDLTAKVTLSPEAQMYIKHTWTDSIQPYPDTNPNYWKKRTYTDSIAYNDTLSYIYRVYPDMEVVQNTSSGKSVQRLNGLPFYGEKDFVYKTDYSTVVDTVSLVSVENNVVDYTFGYPIYQTSMKYPFTASLRESYTNWKTKTVDNIPVVNERIVIKNDMGSNKQAQDFYTDSIGEVYYEADVVEPEITTGLLSIEFDYPCIYAQCPNTKITAIVLGGASTGNNFMTEGPDKVFFVLRDPPGSNSYAYVEQGYSNSTKGGFSISQDVSGGFYNDFQLGAKVETITGTGVPALVGVAAEMEIEHSIGFGFTAKEEFSKEREIETTFTTTQRIETSSDPGWVGADADVYVGASTNIVYGDANIISIADSATATARFDNKLFISKDGKFKIGKHTGKCIGQSFRTTFFYTQRMIEQSLIPEWKDYIRTNLEYVGENEAQTAADNRKKPVYRSHYTPTDERFGEINNKGLPSGDSYTIVYPSSWTDTQKEEFKDSVQMSNYQITIWEKYLALNEKAKVAASQATDGKFNYSFSSGVSLDYSEKRDSVNDFTTLLGGGFTEKFGGKTGTRFNKSGLQVTLEQELNFMDKNRGGDKYEENTSYGFVLADSDPEDKITVDIYGAKPTPVTIKDDKVVCNDGDNLCQEDVPGGYIFITRAGQTQCPYQGEDKTKYYQNYVEGATQTVLNEATMRNEVPLLQVVGQSNVSGVPADGKAVYQIKLINNSESKIDSWYNLRVAGGTNPDGAIVRMDGAVLTETGQPVFVPYGQPVLKTITIERGPREYVYENINLVMASQCQYNYLDEVNDVFSSVQLSATFLSGCSEVTMTDPLDYWVMNTENATSNALSIKVTGFDRNFENLGWVDVQWKESYSSIWNTLKRYYFSQKVMDGDNTISPENKVLYDGSGQIVYPWDMTSRADGNYEVRAITACVDPVTFAPFIYTTTPAKAGVKDMIRPEPFGRPEPKDGVLDINDEIMIQFNEPIAGGRIIDDNIKVTGILSAGQGPKYHPAAVHFDGASAVANTQNDITLTAPFTVEAWVRPNENYADGEDHVIFSHGDNFMIGIEDGSVYVKANGQKMYSDEIEFANPSPEWGHVAVSYNEKGIVFGYYAYGATTVSFSGNPGAYNQTGRIAIGNSVAGGEGIDADIHDVRVWTTNRSESETAGNMSSIYNGAETNLKHYWRMDEMEGTTAADLAGGLTAALTGATWTMPNPGKDLTLASGSNLNFSGANFGFSNMNDFTIELWFKGNNQKNATLFSAGNGAADSDMGGEQIVYDSSNKLSIFFDKDGKLSLSNNGQTFTMNPTNYTDDQWHHLAFTVNRLGNATMYIDGNSIWNTPASNIGGMTATNYYIGQRGWYKGNAAMNPDFQLDNPFAGQIDEIRIWNAALDAAHIKDQKNVRLKGNELGLTAYYPLESYGVQDGSPVINTSLANFAPGATDAATLTGAAALGNDYAPVKMEGPSINLGYRKVVNGDKILITLTDPRYRLEKSLVTISVDGVQDLNGNKQASAVIWTALINQSQLRWEENELTLEGKPNTTIQQTIQINNTGGEAKTFTIENLPTWLQVTPASGTIAAQASQTITIKAAPGVNVGKYEQTILLNGPKTIDGQPESSDQLTVSLNVKDEAPDWNVNPANYEHNSSVIATLLIDNFYSTDTDDKLAAFVGDECRGVANVTYEPTFGRYVVYLTIYSNDFTADNFVFRIWDAGASEIREAATTSAISWGDGYSFGSINAPVAFSTTDAKLRDLELPTGWTWLSLNTKTDDMSVNNTFGELTNKAEILKSQDAFSATNTGKWQGALTSVDNKQMYKVKMTQASVLHTAGTPVTPADETVTLRPNWNWIGYTPQGMLTVQQALAGLTPSEGDIVKDQTSFATYNKGNWTGSLTTMVPGRGYVYQSNATADKTFTYPYATETKSAPALRADAITNFQPVSSNTYSDNMSIIAVVKRGGDVLRNVEVGAFAGNECRGAQTDGDNGLVFLTVTGQTNDASLSFSVYESATGNVSAAAQTLPYSNDGVAGTIASPYVIQLEGTGVDDVLASNIAIYPNPVKSDLNIIRPWTLLDKVEVIDLSGRILFSEDNFSKSSLNVFDLTPGMYILKVTQNGQSVMLKFTKM